MFFLMQLFLLFHSCTFSLCSKSGLVNLCCIVSLSVLLSSLIRRRHSVPINVSSAVDWRWGGTPVTVTVCSVTAWRQCVAPVTAVHSAVATVRGVAPGTVRSAVTFNRCLAFPGSFLLLGQPAKPSSGLHFICLASLLFIPVITEMWMAALVRTRWFTYKKAGWRRSRTIRRRVISPWMARRRRWRWSGKWRTDSWQTKGRTSFIGI